MSRFGDGSRYMKMVLTPFLRPVQCRFAGPVLPSASRSCWRILVPLTSQSAIPLPHRWTNPMPPALADRRLLEPPHYGESDDDSPSPGGEYNCWVLHNDTFASNFTKNNHPVPTQPIACQHQNDRRLDKSQADKEKPHPGHVAANMRIAPLLVHTSEAGRPSQIKCCPAGFSPPAPAFA